MTTGALLTLAKSLTAERIGFQQAHSRGRETSLAESSSDGRRASCRRAGRPSCRCSRTNRRSCPTLRRRSCALRNRGSCRCRAADSTSDFFSTRSGVATRKPKAHFFLIAEREFVVRRKRRVPQQQVAGRARQERVARNLLDIRPWTGPVDPGIHCAPRTMPLPRPPFGSSAKSAWRTRAASPPVIGAADIAERHPDSGVKRVVVRRDPGLRLADDAA